MKASIWNYLFTLLIAMIICSLDLPAENQTIVETDSINNKSVGSLPALKIQGDYFSPYEGDYISPKEGVTLVECRNLLEKAFKSEGAKGDSQSSLKVEEITTKEIWDNNKIQIFKLNSNASIAIVKNNKILTFLHGMPGIFGVYAADLDKDNIYEIYVNANIGLGAISDAIAGYNVATNEEYWLSMRMKQDYILFVEDNLLKVKILEYSRKHDRDCIVNRMIIKHIDNKTELSFEL